MRTFALILTLSLLFTSVSFAASKSYPMDKVYTVAVDSSYPPFSSPDATTGELVGFDVDIAVALCNVVGIKCKIIGAAFDDLIPGIGAGTIDFAVAGMVKKPDREKHALFTEKYFRSSSLFVELPGSVTISVEGLKGKKIGVQGGTTQEDYLRRTYGDVATIVPMKTFVDIMAATKNRELDVAFIDGLPGYHLLKSDEGLDLEIVGAPVTLGNSSRIAVSKSYPELCDDLTNAIQVIRGNGEYDRITRKYFEFNIY